MEWEVAWPLSWSRTVVLIVAIAFLAGVIGWRIGLPSDGSFNEVDAGFLADMSTHHEGAIALSFAYLPREHDQVVGHFAREIITSQAVEINAMTVMLGNAGDAADAVLEDDVVMDWMGEPVGPNDMPGLASSKEFDELKAATGVAADDLFTSLMINHHAAGVAMADYEAEHGDNEKVRGFARAMARVQRTEIGELNSRRAVLGLAMVTPVTAHSHG
jgi:uncharacterized protein (DUF305 family)